ncbi:MAG: hypothetical protein ACE5JE_02340 [Thermoplasmata archaeon]
MKLATFLERERPWERYEAPMEAVKPASHRPKKRFRVRIDSPRDAVRARKQGFPIILIQSDDLRILHYPMRIPPTLLVPREYRDVLDTSLAVRGLQALEPFDRPRIEDIVVFLLMHDPLAARAVVERNLDLLDLPHLTKRIYQENLEEEATLVNLQDYVTIPPMGDPLPREAVQRALRDNQVSAVLP